MSKLICKNKHKICTSKGKPLENSIRWGKVHSGTSFGTLRDKIRSRANSWNPDVHQLKMMLLLLEFVYKKWLMAINYKSGLVIVNCKKNITGEPVINIGGETFEIKKWDEVN